MDLKQTHVQQGRAQAFRELAKHFDNTTDEVTPAEVALFCRHMADQADELRKQTVLRVFPSAPIPIPVDGGYGL